MKTGVRMPRELEDKIVAKYNEGGLSYGKIANMLNLSTSGVRNVIRRNNGQEKKMLDFDDMQQMVKKAASNRESRLEHIENRIERIEDELGL